MKRKVILILTVLVFQACYFGIGLVEYNLPGNFMLFANNSIDELSINYQKDNSTYNIIVDETVQEIGFNDDFITAKSFSSKEKESYYHIIEVKKELIQDNLYLTKEDFNKIKKQKNIAFLDFSITHKDLE